MTNHFVSIEPVDGEYIVRCSSGDLSKKYPLRNLAFLAGHLHIVGIGVKALELAEAGEEFYG